jgi:hypothetical protein
MAYNYFNCIYSIPNAVGSFLKYLFTNCISFCEFLVHDPQPLGLEEHWHIVVKLTLCL